jgi:hypothetical protein
LNAVSYRSAVLLYVVRADSLHRRVGLFVALVALAGGRRRRSVEMVQLISNTGSKQQAAGFIMDQQASVIRHQSSGIGHQASVIAHAGQ